MAVKTCVALRAHAIARCHLAFASDSSSIAEEGNEAGTHPSHCPRLSQAFLGGGRDFNLAIEIRSVDKRAFGLGVRAGS